MLPSIIFCAAVSLALIAVVLLALFSPIPHETNHQPPSLALRMYIQPPHIGVPAFHTVALLNAGALVYRRTLTETPEIISKVVGKAQGFIIPMQHFAHSAFNIIYLTFDTHDFSGSVSVQARDIVMKRRAELPVVGGTGSFAFARGVAVFRQSDGLNASYRIELHLQFPNRSQTIQGIG